MHGWYWSAESKAKPTDRNKERLFLILICILPGVPVGNRYHRRGARSGSSRAFACVINTHHGSLSRTNVPSTPGFSLDPAVFSLAKLPAISEGLSLSKVRAELVPLSWRSMANLWNFFTVVFSTSVKETCKIFKVPLLSSPYLWHAWDLINYHLRSCLISR